VSASYPGFFADATDQLSSLLNEDDAATIAASAVPPVSADVVRSGLSRARKFTRAHSASLLSNRPRPTGGPPSGLERVHDRWKAMDFAGTWNELEKIRNRHRRDPQWYRYAISTKRQLALRAKEEGRPEDAERLLEEAAAFGMTGLQYADTPDVRWHVLGNFANVRDDQGRRDEAIELWERAARLAPDEVAPQATLLAIACREREQGGDLDRAKRHLDLLLDIAVERAKTGLMTSEERTDLVLDLGKNKDYDSLRSKRAWRRARRWVRKNTPDQAGLLAVAPAVCLAVAVFFVLAMLGWDLRDTSDLAVTSGDQQPMVTRLALRDVSGIMNASGVRAAEEDLRDTFALRDVSGISTASRMRRAERGDDDLRDTVALRDVDRARVV
jgi:hypothetical protein